MSRSGSHSSDESKESLSENFDLESRASSAPQQSKKVTYSYFTFGTRVKTKPKDPLERDLEARGISKTISTYENPNKNLIFNFIDNVLLEAEGADEDPEDAITRVKQQMIEDTAEPYDQAIEILKREDLNQEGAIYRTARKMWKRTGEDREKAIIEIRKLKQATLEKLNAEIEIIDLAVTPFVIRNLLEKLDSVWRRARYEERSQRVSLREKKNLNSPSLKLLDKSLREKERKRAEGISLEAMQLIKAFVRTKRDDPLEYQPVVEPKLEIRVDPNWDEKLGGFTAEKKEEVLHQVIAWLGEKLSSEMSSVHIARIAKSVDGYKVWFVNDEPKNHYPVYFDVQHADSSVREDSGVVFSNDGVSVRALKFSNRKKEMISPQPVLTPLWIEVKAADLRHANLAQVRFRKEDVAVLTRQGNEDRIHASMIHAVSEDIGKLVEKDIQEAAQLDMSLNVSADSDIKKAYQEAQLRLAQLRTQLASLDEKFSRLKSEGEIMKRVQSQGGAHILEEIMELKDRIYARVGEQIKTSRKIYADLTQRIAEMSSVFREQVLADDKVIAKEQVSTPLRLTIDEFFSSPHQDTQNVFMELLKVFVPENKEINSKEMLSRFIKDNLSLEQLLQRLNVFLQARYKKGDSLYSFSQMLVKELQNHLEGSLAFSFNKKNEGEKLIYNEAEMIDQIRRNYEGKVLTDKKSFLENMGKVARVDDDMHVYTDKMRRLEELFEHERRDVAELKEFCNKHTQYIEEKKLFLQDQFDRIANVVKDYDQSQQNFFGDENSNPTDLQVQPIQELNAIQANLTKILNLVKSVEHLVGQNSNLLHFEERISTLKKSIDNHESKMLALIENVEQMTHPLRQRHQDIATKHKDIFMSLRALLLGNKEFWTRRVKKAIGMGGKEVTVNGETYKVPDRIATMIKKVQELEDSELEPTAKLKNLLALYPLEGQSASSPQLFSKVKKAMANATRSDKSLEFYSVIEDLARMSSSSDFYDASELTRISNSLNAFKEKKYRGMYSDSPVSSKSASSAESSDVDEQSKVKKSRSRSPSSKK